MWLLGDVLGVETMKNFWNLDKQDVSRKTMLGVGLIEQNSSQVSLMSIDSVRKQNYCIELHSHTGNDLFPGWEHFIPSKGTIRSQRGRSALPLRSSKNM